MLTKISVQDLTELEFHPVERMHIFNIIPDMMYKHEYIVNGDECPVFVIEVNGEFCHVVPAYNELKCAFVPIKSKEQLKSLSKHLKAINSLNACTGWQNRVRTFNQITL